MTDRTPNDQTLVDQIPSNEAPARPMRRIRQELDPALTDEILARGSWGTLAVLGDAGYPYAVPVNYVWLDGAVYFHCALQGHKLDAILACDKVCFTVVDSDEVVPEAFTTLFRSAIVFGRASVVEDGAEKLRTVEALGRKFMAPGDEDGLHREIEGGVSRMHMVRIDPERITGKEAIELVRARAGGLS